MSMSQNSCYKKVLHKRRIQLPDFFNLFMMIFLPDLLQCSNNSDWKLNGIVDTRS